jgi:RNA polymerase sigma-70 factor, ECF subfamily
MMLYCERDKFRINKSAIFILQSAICGLLIADCRLLFLQYFMPCKVYMQNRAPLTSAQNDILLSLSCLILFPLSEDPVNTSLPLDEKSFEVLFKKHFKDLVFYAQRYVKDLDTAKEITHDAFISLWEKRDTFDTSKPATSWLGTTIHNKCLNHLRDNKKFDRNIIAFEHLDPHTDHASDILISEETHKMVYKAIDELPEKCREIFNMNRFEELKYQEIADKLGISIKTVETQMSKALQHMRTRLSSYLKMMLVLLLYYWGK